MAMIKKTVTGSAEDLKAIKNAKAGTGVATGGTQRTSFKGSNDTRSSGKATANKTMKKANGYVDQGPVTSDLSNDNGKKYTNGGPKASVNKRVMTETEDVTKGMGGKFTNKVSGKF